MTLRTDDNLPWDSEIFEEINTHLTLNKGKYYGTLSCSYDYLKRMSWNNELIKKEIKRKTIVVNIFEVWKFVKNIPDLKEDILYLPYFECDKRCFDGERRELRPEDKNYIDETLNELNENIEKLWKSKASFLFVFSHKMFNMAHETRYFKWMMKNSVKHHYKVYGITPTEIPTNPMSFIRKK